MVFAFSAALCWGFTDFFGATQARRLPAVAVTVVIQAAAFGAALLIVGGQGTSAPPLDLIGIGLVTGLTGGLAALGIYASLAMGNMARVAPVFATAAVIPVIVGLSRGDAPSQLQLVGMAAATVGVVMVSVRAPTDEPEREHRTGLALALAGLTTIGIGLTLTGVARVSEYDPYWAVLLLRIGGVAAIGSLAMFVARDSLTIPPQRLLPLAGIGVLNTAADALWALGSTQGLLSTVAVLGSVFPAVTVVLALVILHERLNWIQIPGVVLTLLGSALIAGG